jgi:hypothetical protein
MKKNFRLAVLNILLLFIFTGCSSLPKYEIQGDFNEGLNVNVGGVIYSSGRGTPVNSGTIWEPNNEYKKTLIGEDKNYSYGKFYSFNEDSKKIFLVEKFDKEFFSIFSEGFGDFNFKRTDIQLPAYDLNGIDKVGIANTDIPDYKDYKFINISSDRQTIEKILALKNEPAIEGKTKYYKYCYTIFLMNSNFPGISIQLPVYLTSEDSYMVNMIYDGKDRGISQDLLEQIAGQKLPTPSEYIASQQKTAG